MKLIVVRHAKTETKTAAKPDFERVLEIRGQKDAQRIGKWLRDHGHIPQRIVCSSARRTRETLQLLDFDVEETHFLDELYLAGSREILNILGTVSDTDSLMYIGHNDGLTDFVCRLCDAQVGNVPTCGVCIIELDKFEFGAGKLQRFLSPKDL